MIDLKRIAKDIGVIVALCLIGAALMDKTPELAALLGIPSMAVAGLMAGSALIAGGVSHLARRVLFPGYDLRAALRRNEVSAIGVCIVLAALILASSARAAEIPPASVQYLPVLKTEQRTQWASMPAPYMLAGQIEQETCITLRHRSCWNPRAELKTDREYGFGLGQITVTSRFDNFKTAKTLSPSLRDWSWDSRFDAAKQLRVIVLMDLAEYRAATDARTNGDRLAFMFAAYNGGRGGLMRDRALCSGTPGCDPGQWFGHVEQHSWRAKVAATGYGQSFFAINRGYVANILNLRGPRYQAAWYAL